MSIITLEGKVEPPVSAPKGGLALEAAFEDSNQHERLYDKIRQLLKEANAAKDNGQWQKAQNLLWELRKTSKVRV